MAQKKGRLRGLALSKSKTCRSDDEAAAELRELLRGISSEERKTHVCSADASENRLERRVERRQQQETCSANAGTQ
jgi:hypothetical protein